jgi:hypothetical protein
MKLYVIISLSRICSTFLDPGNYLIQFLPVHEPSQAEANRTMCFFLRQAHGYQHLAWFGRYGTAGGTGRKGHLPLAAFPNFSVNHGNITSSTRGSQ